MDTPPRPAVPQPPTPYLQRTSWKGGWFFRAGPGMENVAPLVESFYSLTRQNQERFAGRALSAPSPACAGGSRGPPGPAPPLPSPGCSRRAHGKVQGGRAWRPPKDKAQLSQQTRGEGSSPGLLPRSSGTLFPTSPPPRPTAASSWCGGWGPLPWSLQRPRGHPGDWL